MTWLKTQFSFPCLLAIISVIERNKKHYYSRAYSGWIYSDRKIRECISVLIGSVWRHGFDHFKTKLAKFEYFNLFKVVKCQRMTNKNLGEVSLN